MSGDDAMQATAVVSGANITCSIWNAPENFRPALEPALSGRIRAAPVLLATKRPNQPAVGVTQGRLVENGATPAGSDGGFTLGYSRFVPSGQSGDSARMRLLFSDHD